MTGHGDVTGDFAGGYCNAYLSDYTIEVNLPEWSGRIPRNEAVAELRALIAFAQQTIDAIEKSENVTVSEQPEVQPESVIGESDEVDAAFEAYVNQQGDDVAAFQRYQAALAKRDALRRPIPAPIYPGQLTTWGMCKRMLPHGWRSDLKLLGVIPAIYDVPFEIVQERAKSWREEIVEQALLEDAS
jgi:hypothetical protein